jgi:hypothetical protein
MSTTDDSLLPTVTEIEFDILVQGRHSVGSTRLQQLNEVETIKAMCVALNEYHTAMQSSYIPECDENGDFRSTQCYRVASKDIRKCWCIDEAGNRINDVEFTFGDFDCRKFIDSDN